MKMERTTTIDLSNYRTKGAKVFSGRDRGLDVRNKSHIDELESLSDKIVIKIPDDIYSINPSFLEEFLFNVVQKLRAQGFQSKFEFINEGKYKISHDLDEAIERILREKNALL